MASMANPSSRNCLAYYRVMWYSLKLNQFLLKNNMFQVTVLNVVDIQ